MDGLTLVAVFVASMGLFAGVIMILDLRARKAELERMAVFIFTVIGSAAILMLSFPADYILHALVWIVFVAVLGWVGHWFCAT